METYFIKSLPDKRVIKSNQRLIKNYPIQDDHWPSRRWKEDMSDYADLSGVPDTLYVCSRDIKLKDSVMCFDYPTFEFLGTGIVEQIYGHHIDNNQYTDVWASSEELNYQYPAIRVIGHLSPNAIWVKEGDEFSIEQLAWMSDSGNDMIYPFTQIKESFDEDQADEPIEERETHFDDFKGTVYIAIQNPLSKTFH